jgi:hypothetical protein
MGMFFEVLDGPKLHWVLLGVIWLSKLVLDVQFSVDFGDLCTGFFSGIIPSEGSRTTFLSNKILINLREVVFMFHSIDIDDMGLESKKHLGTGEAMKDTFDIGKEGISGDNLIEPVGVQVWKSRLDMPPHGVSDDHLSQLGGLG